jgi:hypothetical protein
MADQRLPLMDPMTWRVRLRFRLQKRLNIQANEHHLSISGHEVVLSPQVTEQAIRDNEWLVMNARGFTSQDEALRFGTKLRSALEVSAVAVRVGVDAGRDLATTGLGRGVREEILRSTGALVRDNIHGLDVFVDNPNTRIIHLSATGSVLASAEPFLSDLGELYGSPTASQRVADVILLLNYALMRPEPVAQIVFAVSAVESLGQDETWSPDQRRLLRELSRAAEESATGTDAERREVSDAIEKSLHRLTLRQGVFRLLDSLGLANLKRAWDALYAERSILVHGLAPRPGADYGDLAHRTVGLCGQILLKAIATEIPAADRYVERVYAR